MNREIVRYMQIAMVVGLITVSEICLISAEETTIVAFGDSTTAKRGELKVYCDVIEAGLTRRSLPVRVINSGVGGSYSQCS